MKTKTEEYKEKETTQKFKVEEEIDTHHPHDSFFKKAFGDLELSKNF